MVETARKLTRLDALAECRENNFDALRLIFAVCVLYSHCFFLTRSAAQISDITNFSHGQTYLGEIAVTGFFAISGFLISMSWFRSKGIGDYLKKRIVRIYPGFVVSSLVCALIVAPLGAPSVREYFAQFHAPSFLTKSLTLAKLSLPLTFPSNLSQEVNGSLWTIRMEFECYLLVPVLAFLGFLRKRVIVLAVTVLALLWNAFGGLAYTYLTHHVEPESISQHEPFLCYFLVGMCFYLYREKIILTRKNGFIAVALLAITALTGGFLAVLPILGVYLIFIGAYSGSRSLLPHGKVPDLSYGVYLYSWPIQQIILQKFGDLNPYLLFILVLPLVCGMAALSWYGVEKPFLRLKPRPRILKMDGK